MAARVAIRVLGNRGSGSPVALCTYFLCGHPGLKVGAPDQSIVGITMRSHLKAALCFAVLALGIASNQSYAADKLPEVSPEGLKLMPKTKAAAVYLREGVSFSGYTKVAILDCYVAFRKNWQRDMNATDPFKVKDDDVMRIKKDLGALFKEVFTKELTKKGQTVTTEAGPGVLILRPALVNLYVTAPDTMSASRSWSYAADAGQATLFMEFYDGVSGELLARVLDTRVAGDDTFATARSRVTNRADAEQMLAKWAVGLGTYLENARASAATAAGAAPASSAKPAATK